MNTRVPAKSILKQGIKPGTTPEQDEAKAKADRDKHNLNIALQHAYRIQNQKDAEAHILDAIMQLMELPASMPFTSREALTFLTLIVPFQPSDFDSLVEERRIDGRCGYVLCLNPPRRSTLAMKLRPGAADWCSDLCARKGLYVKSQLSSVPVWERLPDQKPDIQLQELDQIRSTEEAQSPENTAVRRANRTIRVDGWRQQIASEEQLEQLAAERGEGVNSFRPGQILADGVVEKKISRARVKAPELDEALDAAFDAIEGYQPVRKGKTKQEESDED